MDGGRSNFYSGNQNPLPQGGGRVKQSIAGTSTMSAIAFADTQVAFDVLCTRWSALQRGVPSAGACGAGHMAQAARLLEDALARYLPWMSETDLALYECLLRARDADELGAQFFRCFDLMVRVRGAAVGVLRMHELFRLLQPHVKD